MPARVSGEAPVTERIRFGGAMAMAKASYPPPAPEVEMLYASHPEGRYAF
jgi:hypothetical protein